MTIRELTEYLDQRFPLYYQEDYDNSGLIYGDPDKITKKALVTLDVTREVLDEAIKLNCDLIIAHHPVVFKPLAKFNGTGYSDSLLIKAIKADIALYAMHTNLDNSNTGHNNYIGIKLGITEPEILRPRSGLLRKLVTFCPVNHASPVREALFAAGAGHIGNYDKCSFNTEGEGTFMGSDISNPFVGEKGKLHKEKEIRIETIYPVAIERRVIKALLASHPYEEVAYDIYELKNSHHGVGSGIIGFLDKPIGEIEFLERVRKVLPAERIMYSKLRDKSVKKVAFCGGSGAFLISEAIKQEADVFITGEIKYHDFLENEMKILLVAPGHYETEHFSKDIIEASIHEKFPNFAVLKSSVNTNPVYYK